MIPKISLIQTASLYIGPRNKRDRWKWAVCVEGDLDSIKHVTYKLHKSQPKETVEVDTPQTRFTVSGISNGWFEVNCRVRLKTDELVDLEPLKLMLHYPDHADVFVRDS